MFLMFLVIPAARLSLPRLSSTPSSYGQMTLVNFRPGRRGSSQRNALMAVAPLRFPERLPRPGELEHCFGLASRFSIVPMFRLCHAAQRIGILINHPALGG